MVIYMTYNIVMLKVSIADAKARLSEYLKRAESGETIIFTKRNVPMAEIRPLRRVAREPRPVGLCAQDFRVPPEFDRPLPANTNLADIEGA